MGRKIIFIGAMITLILSCTSVKVTKLETVPDEVITVDLTGIGADQKEMAKGMINEIIPLIKAGKTEGEIINILQEREAKKITRYQVEVGDSPSRGPEDAKVTLIEFSSFQCGYSKRAQTTIEQILEKYPQGVRHVFKQNPLYRGARLAAEASLAAGAQGMFWEMKDILFENRSRLKEEHLLEYAEELGLDIEQFKTDLKDHKFKGQVDREEQQAVKIGATGTPAFFINGRFLSGAKPLESFVKVIDEELSGKKIPFKWGKNVKDERKKKQRREEDPNKIYNIPVGEAPYKGPKDAPITVVMFTEFQCPFSNRGKSTLEQLMKKYQGQIKLVFKHFPLGFHKNAMVAAETSMAAGAQGKFWEMYDKMFANQKQLSVDNLKEYAQGLNLDMKKFNEDLETHRFKKIIDGDMKVARGAGVRGTPTFFINGRKLVGAKPLAEFQKVIDEILKEKK